MNDEIYIDTDLINDAYNQIKKAYKILTTNNILDTASSIEKMDVIKELSSYKYLKGFKDEVDELISKAEKAKDKCKNLISSSNKVTSFSGFSFFGFQNMKLLTETIFKKGNNSTNNAETKNQEKESQDVIVNDNPNYNNSLDIYMANIKKDLGLEQLEKEMGVEIKTSKELISMLEVLKENFANNKTEKAQLEVVIKQLKRYSEIDEFEKKYTTQSGYSGNEQLSDTTKIAQKQENAPQIEGTSSIEKAYIEYQSFKDYLSEDQQHILAYIYKTEGEEKAYEYYHLLQDQINQLKGMEKAVNEYNKIKSAGQSARSTTTTSSFENIFGGSAYGGISNYYNAKKTSQQYMTEYAHSIIKGTVNGLEGFTESFENINNSNATELDYERMYLIEALQNDKDLAKGLEETYGFSESVGNMLPTVTAATIISVSTGGTGAPAAAKLLQTAVTSSMIFGSSYGSKKHQNLLNGYTEEDSKKSAVVSAFSETLLEEALGSLPGIGKKSTNVLLNMFKEGGQEAIQQFAENLGDSKILEKDLDLKDYIDDSAKAFIYGALISATFEAGHSIIYNGTKIIINKKTLNKLKTAVNSKNEVEVQKILQSLPSQAAPSIDSQIKKLDKQYERDYNSFISGLNESIKSTLATQNKNIDDYYKYTDTILDEIKQGNYSSITSKNGWRKYIESYYIQLCNRSDEYVSKRESLVNQRAQEKSNKKNTTTKIDKSYIFDGYENKMFGTENLLFHRAIKNGITICDQVYSGENVGNIDIEYRESDIFRILDDMEQADKKLIKAVKKIYITGIANPDDAYWANIHQRDFCSAATGGNGIINIYKYSTKGDLRSTMYHEAAHNFDKGFKVSNSEEWNTAAKKDNNFPSSYAKEAYNKRTINRYAEDFADSIAKLRELGFAKFSKQYPNRAKVLKKQLPDLCNNIK